MANSSPSKPAGRRTESSRSVVAREVSHTMKVTSTSSSRTSPGVSALPELLRSRTITPQYYEIVVILLQEGTDPRRDPAQKSHWRLEGAHAGGWSARPLIRRVN